MFNGFNPLVSLTGDGNYKKLKKCLILHFCLENLAKVGVQCAIRAKKKPSTQTMFPANMVVLIECHFKVPQSQERKSRSSQPL
ncbi:hypothetical protein L1887_10305 [Cichorium endivia]|nr:hypothetical protein L1887_10305 [Cichorium endivia]